MVIDSSGSRTNRPRIATIGSSTDPAVPDSGPGLAHRARVGGRSAAAEEAQAVRLVREDGAGRRAVRRQEMEHPG